MDAHWQVGATGLQLKSDQNGIEINDDRRDSNPTTR